MPAQQLMNPVSAAATIGVTVQTLARWRVEGRGPEFLKIGRAVRYDASKLEAWINRCRRRSTSDPAGSGAALNV